MATVSLTKQDIRAMKNADSVYFGYRKPGYGNENLPEKFYARTRLDAPHSTTGYDQEHVFAIDGRIQNGSDTVWAGDVVYHYDPEWRTVIDLLREGDELTVDFYASNDSESLRKAGYTTDEMRLQVVRPLSSGKTRRMTFNLTHRTVPVTSTARIVHPTEYTLAGVPS